MFRFKSNKFLYDTPTDGAPSGPMSVSDIEDMLKDDGGDKEVIDLKDNKDDKTELPDAKEEIDDKEEKEDGDEEVVDDDELKRLEEDLKDEEEVDENQLELTTPVRRRDILKKYPQLFKDFPYLEKAYYREQAFTEILPTIEDAREAVQSKEALDKFGSDLMRGDLRSVLAEVKAQDQNGFYQIVDNLLPNLAEVDPAAYHHLMGNTLKHTVLAMLQEAKRTSNETLQSAAQILYQYTFGTSEWKPPTNLAMEVKEEDRSNDRSLERREQELNHRQFDNSRLELNTRVNNAIKSTIEQNIDPKSSMTEYVKKTAIRQVQEDLNSMISQDKRFRILTDKLWEKAHRNGYDKRSLDDIRTAFTSKARTLLPSVIKKARIEALRGMGKRVREESDTPANDKDEKREVKGTPRPNNSGTSKKTIPPGMSTLEFLNQD